jgi:polysaccharide pyruvyl transferase WcaK-like protein
MQPESIPGTRRAQPKIILFGHFGGLNTGNEGTLIAILTRLRSLYPAGEFCCICTGPQSVTLRHGIDAVPISTRSVRIWDRRRPLHIRLATFPVAVAAEIGEWLRAFRTLEGSTMLIVPGGGMLTDAYGVQGWGPYNITKWSVAAKLRGCKVFLVSVGAGPIYTRPGRLFVRSALALADYKSLRDRASLLYLESIGFRGSDARVYPDLVFSLLPHDFLSPDVGSEQSGRRIVGVGLMRYQGRYSAKYPSAETVSEYFNVLSTFVEWLLARDYDVRLLLGDADPEVVEDFTSLLRERVEPYSPERVSYRPAETVGQILSALAATDVVVATRFHNVLMAVLLNKPVLAISHHHKCESLMSEMGLSEYSQDIHHMDAPKLIRQFQDLERDRTEVKERIRERVEAHQEALDEQYAALFGAR